MHTLKVLKRPLLFSLLALVIPLLIYIVCLYFHPINKVGVILEEGIDPEYYSIIESGFREHYPDYFELLNIDKTFSTKDIRKSDKLEYLNNDFFTKISEMELHSEYGLDNVLIVTDKRINNWDTGGGGIWGQASSQHQLALMTINRFNNEAGIPRIKSLAMHEMLHLFGYPHNPINRNGIMQYVAETENTQLVPYSRWQLPIRAIVINYLKYVDTRYLFIIANFFPVLILFPVFLVFDYFLFVNIENKNRKVYLFRAIALISSFAMITALNFSFTILLIPLLLSLMLYNSVKSQPGKWGLLLEHP